MTKLVPLAGDGEAEPGPGRGDGEAEPGPGRGDAEGEPGPGRGDAEGEPGHRGRGRSRAVLRLVVAIVALLPLVLAAMAKPSRVETGVMPMASLDIEGEGAAEPSCAWWSPSSRSCRWCWRRWRSRAGSRPGRCRRRAWTSRARAQPSRRAPGGRHRRAPAAGAGGDGEAEPGRDRGDADGEPGHRGRGRSRGVLRLVVAIVALLPLVLAAMAKPSRVETGAMPMASLDIEGEGAAGEPGHRGRGRSRAVLRLVVAIVALLPLVPGRCRRRAWGPGRWRSRAVLRLVVAIVALLPLVLAAMAKPSRVETEAMPKASLDIEGEGAAEPSCAWWSPPSRSCRWCRGDAEGEPGRDRGDAVGEPSRLVPADRRGRSLAAGLVPRATPVVPTRTFLNSVL